MSLRSLLRWIALGVRLLSLLRWIALRVRLLPLRIVLCSLLDLRKLLLTLLISYPLDVEINKLSFINMAIVRHVNLLEDLLR